MHRIILVAALSATPLVAMARDAGKDIYTLGELQVTARSHAGEALGGAVISGMTTGGATGAGGGGIRRE